MTLTGAIHLNYGGARSTIEWCGAGMHGMHQIPSYVQNVSKCRV